MSRDVIRPKGYITDGSEQLLGIGAAHAVSGPEDVSEPDGLWLPMHRSGSLNGGWKKQPISRSQPLGFRKVER